jgi:hypothetical protein
VTVTANNPVEPVNGGTIFFVPPQNTVFPPVLPSALVSQPPIVNGTASATATANGVPGSYQVAAFLPKSSTVEFDLTNQAFTPANIQAAIIAAGPGGITFQPSANIPLDLILRTLASLGHQSGTAKVILSLPPGMLPYPSITAELPAGLNFTLEGNGSTVNGNVTISQPGDVDPSVDNLNVTGDLQIEVGNADDSAVVVTRSNVSGNVQIQTGNGVADSVTIRGLTVGGDTELETGNGKADAISADALIVGGALQIETGNGAADAVVVTAVSGPTTITGNTQIHLGNGAGDTATVNGSSSNGTTFDGSFTLQMGNGGNTVNIGTLAGIVTFGGTVHVQFGNGTNTLNLAATATQSGGVPGSQVYFKKAAVFDGRRGKNTKYVGASGVNVFGAPQFDNS